MNYRLIPNIITVFRLFLVIPISILLLSEHYRLAFTLFIVAGLSDGIDGFLARHYQWMTRFGAITDPLADKILILVTYACLTWHGKIPVWLFTIVLFRDIWIIAGAVAYRSFIGELQFKPLWISKINTVLQIVFVVIILFEAAFVAVPTLLVQILTYLVLLTTLASLVDYTWVWGRRALKNARLRSL